MKENHALATAADRAAKSLASQIIGALRGVIPRDLPISLTATQRRGKLRVEIHSVVHEEGWRDCSG
jgi:hypothetical protein